MALLSKERLQERLRQSRERQKKKRKAEKERREAIKREVLAEIKKPKKIKLIKLDDEKYISHRNVGEKTVEGRGYEPYEAVKYASTNLSYNKKEMIMIGDASGKPGDFSDSDKKCAENFGIDYIDVRDFLEL